MDDTILTTRILDAAAECLKAGGFSRSRLQSEIAQRARVSRPTIYKYFGDQDAVLAALLRRELSTFLDMLSLELERAQPTRTYLVNLVAFVVEYAREQDLLQAVIRDAPEQVLPWFTTRAQAIIEQVAEFAQPPLEQQLSSAGLPTTQLLALIEWLCRLTISLIFTHGVVPVDDRDALRQFIETLFDFGGVLSGDSAGRI